MPNRRRKSGVISYAQRFEDLYLLRCFGTRNEGFYIDIGSGHPVYDNMSFAFYLTGWHGITVEPNPWLARLSRAIRARDRHIEALVGASSGEATFYLVSDFHGLSTMIESNARSAQSEFGKSWRAITAPLMTLEELCNRYAPSEIDFLKVDVEGAEQDVLLHGNWYRHRPKVVIAEALAPYTLAPAWEAWEPCLTKHGYRYIWFDTLNRYYIAEEAAELASCFTQGSEGFDAVFKFRNVKPALADEAHPDHHLAVLVAGSDLTHLPLVEREILCKTLTAGIPRDALDKPAGAADIEHAIERLFGPHAALLPAELRLPRCPRVRDVYAAIVQTDQFCAACGRISASYAW
jgi:FkbM family methyltransferase